MAEPAAHEESYRSLLDQMPIAVFSCDAAGVIQQFNRRAAELWGREPALGDTDERFCKTFRLFRLDGSLIPYEQCPMAELASGRLAQVCDAELVIERPDGSRVTVVANALPLVTPHGEVAGAIYTFFDITRRKQDEEEARDRVSRLADADRRKNEFLAMLAHEIRNPLATIRAGLRVQQLSGTDDRTSRSVTELMERQVGHLVGLVDDLLDVNRIGRGKLQLRKSRVDLATVVHAAVETARSLMERREHEFTLTVPAKPIWLGADPLRLAQVIGNLLNNAAKFTETGGRISLTAALEAQEAVIRVRDNGSGIAADQLAHIFDMFMQAEATVEGSGSGVGIGLALVKSLVEMHDGTVEAHSAGLGHGSEFIVRLPLTSEPLTLPTSLPDHPAVAETIGRCVLVVDDNRDAAESLAMLLKLSGHDAHVAHDGLEAVEKASSLKPDVVLLDIGLPKINGFEAARRIREAAQGAGPLIVALTGWAQDTDRQKSREAGINAHIAKPVDAHVLASLLLESPAAGAIG